MFRSKNLNKEIDNIVNELCSQVYADKKTLENELISFNELLLKLKDRTFEEIIVILFNEVIEKVDLFFSKYNFVPGINITSKINDIIINYNRGYINYNKKQELNNETMFDIASISKTPTAIIMYKQIEDEIIDMYNKVKDILVEYENLKDDFTIRDILSYKGKYTTLGRIDDAENKIEALKRIRSVVLEEESIDKYIYNDIAPILCGKIIEKVSNKNLDDIVKEKILKPLKLNNIQFNTKLNSSNISGTPNFNRGLCNDPKANILEGYPGSAGIFSSTNDMILIMENLLKANLFNKNIEDFYTKNPLKLSRGIAGQSIVPTKIEKNGYFSNLSPIMSLGEDGSTRTIATSGKYILNKKNYYVSEAIFSNPCSSNPDVIKFYEKKYDKKQGTYYKYYSNIDAYRIDIREILPSSSLDEILFSLQRFNLRISLLCEYVKMYEKDYNISKTINLKYRRGV